MSTALSVRDLRRSFGDVQALDGVTFEVPEGSVVGVIGANGAGKTTLFRILATLEVPDSGSASVLGNDCESAPMQVRRDLGWMPDHVGAPPATLVLDYLDFFARAYGLRGAKRRTRLEEVLHFTELEPLALREVKGLSKGQMQRLTLARALLNDPRVMLLDEPAAGLDPKARVEFRNLVGVLRAQGRTLLISSHILSELGEMCDRLLFIDSGRIAFSGTAAELARADRGLPGDSASVLAAGAGASVASSSAVEVEVQFVGPAEVVATWLQARPGCRVLGALPGGLRVEYASEAPEHLAEELRALVEAGHRVHGFRVRERKLEDVFINVLKQKQGGRP